MIKIKLTRIKSNHNNLRTDETTGHTHKLPDIGESLILFSEGITPNSMLPRYIHTTPILSIEGNIYKTRNSTYQIETIEE